MKEFIIKTLSRFGGYNRVRIVSSDQERFFNMLTLHGIPVWSVSTDGVKIYFNVRLSDMDALWETARNFGINIVITENFGALKYAKILKRLRFGIFLGIAILVFIMKISGYIWNVNIYGARITDSEDIKAFLYDNGFRSSISKDRIEKNELELLIKNHFRDISEVVTDIDGVNLNITVFESSSPIVAFDKDVPVDIIATKDCIIDEIDVYNGVGMVDAGEEVKKGDVLISGRVEYLFKDEERYKNVHAIGKTLSYEKVFCDNINVQMYVPKDDVGYSYERRIFLFDKQFTYTVGEPKEDDVCIEVKNLQISFGWLNIPILYDEIRWYNKTDCIQRSDSEIYEEIYSEVLKTLGDGYSVKKMDYTTKEAGNNLLKVSVEIDCAVNVGIERQIKK